MIDQNELGTTNELGIKKVDRNNIWNMKFQEARQYTAWYLTANVQVEILCAYDAIIYKSWIYLSYDPDTYI